MTTAEPRRRTLRLPTPGCYADPDRSGLMADDVFDGMTEHLFYTLGKLAPSASRHDLYMALSYAVRDRLMTRYLAGIEAINATPTRVVAYLSAEFLIGPQLGNNLLMLGIRDEAAEALRWIHYLRPGGMVLMNTARLVPPVVSGGLYEYPADPVGQIRALGIEVHAFDAMAIALELGDVRLGNSVMLGAIADHLPFAADILLDFILRRFRLKKPEMVEVNARAFAAGRAAVAAQSTEESLT